MGVPEDLDQSWMEINNEVFYDEVVNRQALNNEVFYDEVNRQASFYSSIPSVKKTVQMFDKCVEN